MREKRSGNELRESAAPVDLLVADNLPNLFPVEEWNAYYWVVNPEGRIHEGRTRLNVFRGLGEVAREVQVGESGVIEHVRRWGVALHGGLLEAVGFDPTPFLSHDRMRFPSDDAEALYLITQMTHFDLPGYFILASEEHPFLLFDPSGTLKGTFTRWYTHAGALAYMVTDGRLQTSFALMWRKDRELYRRAMQTLEEELEKKRGKRSQT